MAEGTIVIGLGNEMRGDDAAGLQVADLLAASGLDATRCDGEPIDVVERWRGHESVVIVDAVDGGEPGRIRRLPVGAEDLPLAFSRGASTHLLGLAEVLALARQLDLLPDRLEVIGIEGDEFRLGAPPSEAVAGAVVDVAAALVAELGTPSGTDVELESTGGQR